MVGWSFAQCFALLSSLYVVRPLRDEMGILSGVEDMHWLFTGTFVVVLLVQPLLGLAIARVGRARLVPAVYVALAATLVVCFFAMRMLPEDRTLASGIFIWVSVFNLLGVSLFWSLMADVFTPTQSQRLFGAIAAGGSAGAIAGPLLTRALVTVVPASALLLACALLLCGAAACSRQVRLAAGRGAQLAAGLGGGAWQGFVRMVQEPRLRAIAAYLMLMTWVSTTLYFEQSQIVAQTLPNTVDRLRLFANIDLAVNLCALTIQVLLTGRIVRALGLTSVLVALPLVSLGALGALALAPTLGVLAGVQVCRRAINFALAKPAREALFPALDATSKYKGKNVVDTVVYRGGDALAGWGVATFQSLGAGLSQLAWVGVPAALVWIQVARWLGRGAATDADTRD